MNSVMGRTLRAAAVGVALLAAGVACNDLGNEGDRAEAVVLVTGSAVAGASAADGLNTSVTLSLTVEDRTGSAAGSFFNDVVFQSYSVVFTPTLVVPDITGVVNSGYVPIGSTASLALDVVTSGMEAAGSTVMANIGVAGQDVNGRPVTFSTLVAITFTP